MGFLDELKQEADDLQDAEKTARAREEQRVEQARARILPKMQAFARYLQQVVDHLNVVNPDVTVSYKLENFGELSGLKQGKYMVHTDETGEGTELEISWTNSKPGEIEFIRPMDAVKNLKDYLWGVGVTFHAKAAQGNNATFLIEPSIKTTYAFKVNIDSEQIELRIKNLQYVGSTSYKLDPNLLNEEFFDTIARSMVRKPNKLDEFTGNKVSDEVREKLRAQIQAQAAGRDKAGGAKPKKPEAKEKSKEKPKKKGLLGGLLGK